MHIFKLLKVLQKVLFSWYHWNCAASVIPYNDQWNNIAGLSFHTKVQTILGDRLDSIMNWTYFPYSIGTYSNGWLGINCESLIFPLFQMYNTVCYHMECYMINIDRCELIFHELKLMWIKTINYSLFQQTRQTSVSVTIMSWSLFR